MKTSNVEFIHLYEKISKTGAKKVEKWLNKHCRQFNLCFILNFLEYFIFPFKIETFIFYQFLPESRLKKWSFRNIMK
jgi:hypothetical protein